MTLDDASTPISRASQLALVAIFVLGLIARGIIAPLTPGFVHPDEHQQYVEFPFGMVHGYNVQYWEQERGIRHYLYPATVAAAISVMDAVGIGDPLVQSAALRTALSGGVLLVIMLFAWRWLHEGKTAAAFCLALMAAASPDLIFMTTRTLSETAATIPFLLALYCFDKRPLVAGLLLGAMFAIRLQCVFFIPAVGLTALGQDLYNKIPWKQSKLLWLSIGLTLSLLVVGAIDYFTFGAWFHTARQSIAAQVVEDIASDFGVEPWYYYLYMITINVVTASPLLLIALLVVHRYPLYVMPAVMFILGHSLVGHKEFRFIWPTVPLLFILASLALQELLERIETKSGRISFAALFALCFLGGAAWHAKLIDWRPRPSTIGVRTLAMVGRQDDIQGVVVVGMYDYHGGNYFYLRHNVPLDYVPPQLAQRFIAQPQFGLPVNYLVLPRELIASFDKFEPEEIGQVEEWGVYRLRKPSVTPAAP